MPAHPSSRSTVDDARAEPMLWFGVDLGTSICWPAARTLCDVPPRSRTSEPVVRFAPAKLREVRERRKLSHDRLVALVNDAAPAGAPKVNRGQLIYYEQAKNRPGIDVLTALAKALEVDTFELMDVTADTATLADLRARAGLNKTAVATHLGMAPTTWDAIERGRRTLHDDVARQVAKLLKTSRAKVLAAHERGISARAEPPNEDAP